MGTTTTPRHVLVAMDSFTGFLVLAALHGQVAEEIVTLLVERILAILGPPHVILTDDASAASAPACCGLCHYC